MIVEWNTTNKYQIIYSDPPWEFQTWSDKGLGKSAQKHYTCMKWSDIENLPIPDLADKDCLHFMWVTDPLLDKQIKLFEHWGFRYVTVGFTWVKLNKKAFTPFIGCGHYTRSNPEMVLIGRKGKPPRPKARGISQVVLSPIREHSRKPDEIRDFIAEMYPDCTKVELFARTEVPGWDCIGNQVDKFNCIEELMTK